MRISLAADDNAASHHLFLKAEITKRIISPPPHSYAHMIHLTKL